MCFDPEPVEAFTSIWRRARKDHKCFACNETIPAGHRYHFYSHVWEGSAESFKHCARCWRMIKLLGDEIPSTEVVDLALDCGEDYLGDNPSLLSLAFVTPEEAQELVENGA